MWTPPAPAAVILEGSGTFIEGAQGHGSLSGWRVPILDAEGHILSIYAGSFRFEGEWH